MNDVRLAVVNALEPGQALHTPTGKSEFKVLKLDEIGIWVNRLNQPIRWAALNGVPRYMADREGEIDIGARKGHARPSTLEAHLQASHGNQTMRASYAAPILEAAGIVWILRECRPQRIQLRRRGCCSTPAP